MASEDNEFGKGLKGDELEELAVNTIRCLSIDIVQKASSGHPGLPLGAADFAYVLWMKHLKHSPKDPGWPDRDRFILSAGHGAALLYSLLHLFGYNLTMDDLKSFRQWRSITPGHPESGLTPGVETSTGPLGQGFANGVGMALAERMLSARFNCGKYKISDHYTYAIVSDGDMMEGISHEAASLAGHWGLGKLIYFYDFNRITIEGSTDLAYSDDVRKRFESYGWQVLEIDGHDRHAIGEALEEAGKNDEKPSLIIGHTDIGKGSPGKQGTAAAHGEPLGDEEVKATKKNLCFPHSEQFFVPGVVKEHFVRRAGELDEKRGRWREKFDEWSAEFPDKRRRWDEFFSRKLPVDIASHMPVFKPEKPVATREASGEIIGALSGVLPNLIGGAADLAPSTKTFMKNEGSIKKNDFSGRNLHFGVREHGMGGIVNGISLHGGFIPFAATFFVFFDYMRPSVRLAALMKQPVIFIYTHDSIFVGEDGPTHQPVEHLASLRVIPRIIDLRPCDGAETAVAWQIALETRDAPSALLLTRQKMPVLDRGELASPQGVRKGAYVIADSGGTPDVILIASGSEVHPALQAYGRLKEEGIKCRVVNLASWKLFESQTDEYREKVLPRKVKKRVGVEAGSSFGWDRFIGDEGVMISRDDFGASAPFETLAREFGFTADNIISKVRELLKQG